MRRRVGLDFETFSKVNLPVKGLYNYINDPSFKPLMADLDSNKYGTEHFDFIMEPESIGHFKKRVKDFIEMGYVIIAHNAGFERAVLNWRGLHIDHHVKDSAVYARMLGVGEKLEVASRQLPVSSKLESGKQGIMTWCVPNSFNNESAPTQSLIMHNQEDWIQFGVYCGVDAKAGREIADYAEGIYARFAAQHLMDREDLLELITYEMNTNGWKIDRPTVQQMSVRAWANTLIEQRKFFLDTNEQLNFNSPVQLKKYCEIRGVKVKSLDKYQLPLVLERVEKLLRHNGLPWTSDEIIQRRGLEVVMAMLEVKMELGGSSLSKLERILDLSSEDDILRDQYIHVGAGQTFRTSGRGVQMQNLKKLDGNIRDMSTVFDYSCEWSNTDMAGQLRQVFTASHPDGKLFVGDFSAVESRGLAYLAGEEWKLDAYREGLDVYKVLVTKYMGIEYADVTAEQRPRGKYSELSCGYQASGKAVQEFMFRLGFSVTLEDAAGNVADWRKANPNIVQLWRDLDECLHGVLDTGQPQQMQLAYGQVLRISPFYLESIQTMHPGAMSLMIQIFEGSEPIVNRVIHGAYLNGNAICYYKPSEMLNGQPLWTPLNKTATQKQKKDILLSVYGGKLAGILTQSLCRELFYDSLVMLDSVMADVPNAKIVGQFHDEVNVDWWPGQVSEDEMKKLIERAMSRPRLEGFPLIADVKSAYRYIK